MRLLYVRNAEYRKRIEAQRNLVVLGTAAATLAHEIKNPLLSIRLQTGILSKTCGGSGEVAIINEEVERLSSLVYRVNDYLRDARGSQCAVDIAALVRETGERLLGRDIIGRQRLSPAPSDDSGRVMVYADPERLRSVFENLIRNAVESGGKPEEVSVSIECPPRKRGAACVRVIVRDRGKGVSEADLPRVFDPFFTRKSTGTGIGLSISKRFIEAAGGTITLANRQGGGAEATVQLCRQRLPPNASGRKGGTRNESNEE
jgi:two-component system sensor histidine kinase HydH